MTETPRGMAVEILNRVELTDAYAEPLLDACLSCHYMPNIHDRRLLTMLVYGVLRMRGHLDWIIGKYYRGDFASLNIFMKNILRTGLYQLLYTGRIPVFAVVDEAVNLAKIHHPGGASLVNAILRNYLRKREGLVYPRWEEYPLEHIAVVHSHPRWLVRRWLAIMGGKETIALCVANNGIPVAACRVNSLKATRRQVIEELRVEGLEAREAEFSPDGLILANAAPFLRETHGYTEGYIQVQDEASQLIARLVAPEPGDRVLDTCAGAGVKTAHLAEIMENRGQILAVDINDRKTASLKELTKRLGVGIVETMTGDASADLGTAFHEKFDRVLVDAPCSGLGTLRRNPEIKWRLRARDIKVFADMQKKMLNSAAACVKMGGTLVYSVCTVTPEENEAVIEDFLGRHKDFHLTPPPEAIDHSMTDEKGFFRTSPARHGTDGFFGAALVRGK